MHPSRNLDRIRRLLVVLFLAIPCLPGTVSAGASLQTLETFHRGPRNPVAGVIEASDGALYGTTIFGGTFDGGTLFRVNPDGTGFELLHEFDCLDPTNGCNPAADLIEGSDGALYGTTSDGGGLFRGAVFRIQKDGTGFGLVHSFAICATNSCVPGGVFEGTDGALYGTTQRGGAFREGEVFRVNKDGTGYTVLHAFRCSVAGEGCYPSSGDRAGVVEAADGRLYGTTDRGGAADDGILFGLDKDGTGFDVLHEFDCATVPASISCRANGGLIQASNGALYGTTQTRSRVYRIETDGTGFAVVNDLGGEAFGPQTGVIEGSDGALYGSARTGGDFTDGVLFRVNPDGTGFSVVHSFECGDASTDGCLPTTGLFEGTDGRLYGTATARSPLSLDNGLVFGLDKDGTGFSTVHAFRCGGQGCLSQGPLLEASDGALYGTTSGGGASGAGVLFRIGQDGSGFSVLHEFECSATSGCIPSLDGGGLPNGGGLIEARDGALYGTTSRGGAFNTGTLFTIRKDGTGLAFIHSFECIAGRFSCAPAVRLLEGSDGALYGTVLRDRADAPGAVFRIEKDGTGYTVLHSMTCASDGCNPQGGLMEGSDGALYGVNPSNGPLGAGTAFRIERDGSGFAVLRSFQVAADDGAGPNGGLTEGSDGMLYGVTRNGGASFTGTIYGMNKDGTGFSLLHSLDCNTDGCRPTGRLIEGSDGFLYGTASIGVGAASKGSVFRLRRDGTGFEVLHPFLFPCGGGDGCFPIAGVIEGRDGAFYGTTREGGAGAGTLYRLTAEMASVPPTLVVTFPAAGAVVPEGQVLVEGTATDDVGVAGVTVDGIDAALTVTGNPQDPGEVSFSVPLVLTAGDHTIEVIATDDEGNTDTVLVDVHVVPSDDMPPRVSDVVAEPNPAEVGIAVLLTAAIDDSAAGDSNIVGATYTVDGSSPVAMLPSDGAFDSSEEQADADIPGFAAPGVYDICVMAEDAAGNVSSPVCTLLTVYDPDAGFITGGGWFHSLPGAFRPDLSTAGRANLGFVAKYTKDSSIPIGNTEFQEHEAGVNFRSTAYEWLVVPGDGTARYKGTGTVNGSAAPNGTLFQFMVWAGDGEPDTFRIRIWWEEAGQVIDLYDSEITILGGGSIVVH